MADLIKTSLGVFSSVGVGLPRNAQAGYHTVTASLAGSGLLSGTVKISGSNNLKDWVTIATLSLSGTNSAISYAEWSTEYLYWVAEVVGMSAAACEVSVTSDQSQASQLAAIKVPAHVYNLKRSNMATWIAARDSVKAGGSAVLSFFSDSTGASAGAGTGGTTGLIDAKRRGLETKLAQALKKLGIAARGGHFCGNNNVISAAGITYDGTAGTSYCTQLSYTGTAVWSQQTLGGLMLRLNASGEKASWTPTHTFNKIVITYVRNAGLASASVDVDGGASLGTIVGAGATGMVTATFDCTEGTHTVNITTTTAGQFYIRSIRCYSTTRGCVDIMVPSYWGGLVNDFNGTSSAWSPGNVIGIDGQAMTVVKLMTNDANGATTQATYEANMTTLLDRIRTAGSNILLCSGNPFNSANYTSGKAATFVASLKEKLAVTFDCPFVDLDGYFGPQTEQRLGYYYDNLHPAEVMYAEEADLYARVLAAV